MKKILAILALLWAYTAMQCPAQIVVDSHAEPISGDSIRQAFENQPYFGIYKDNYFLFGPSVAEKPTAQNTNVKFQISIAQRLTKSVLPMGTYLYLFYSQKVFWNVLERSMPMTDLNFNPGIGLAKPIYYSNRYIGKVTLMVEHESNGRDGDASRSWNKISLGANIMIDPNVMVHGKFWIPIIDSQNNRDILSYSGIYQMCVQLMSNDRRFTGAVTVVKRKGWNLNYNTIAEVGIRMWKNANEFLILQWYNGYGEGLLDYNKYHSQLRIGLLIKPNLFSDF